uniref:Uncharacterized protein n=1 Tax=Nelumbo nucifera TaxID=4432 RepID=A0A822ZAQ4_NELNU|nr:TPA_asm: hypothetical protein HUJ06_015943 [Nelumbo nucifera]
MHACAYSLPLDGAPSHDQITSIKKFHGGLSGTVKSLPKYLEDFLKPYFLAPKEVTHWRSFWGKSKGWACNST